MAAQRNYFDIEWSIVKLNLEQWQISYIRRIFNAFNLNNRQLNSKGVLLDIRSGGSGYLTFAAAEEGYLSIGCDLSLDGMLNARRLSKLKVWRIKHCG